MPAPDRSLAISDLTGQAGSFRLGPVSLAIEPGQVLAMLGPSGAGKTMLLETIAGLRPHRSGTIRLAGADITAWPPEQRRIGLVFQDAALFPHLSVAENIRFGPRATRQAPAADLDSLLRRLGITPLAARAPRSLSGGERQRVALARALAIQPALLLLDEPLSALDQPTREDLRTLLRELLAALDIPAVHVTHDRDEALSISNDLAIITGGQLRQAARPARSPPPPPTPKPPACSAGQNSDRAPPQTAQCRPARSSSPTRRQRASRALSASSTGPKTSHSERQPPAHQQSSASPRRSGRSCPPAHSPASLLPPTRP